MLVQSLVIIYPWQKPLNCVHCFLTFGRWHVSMLVSAEASCSQQSCGPWWYPPLHSTPQTTRTLNVHRLSHSFSPCFPLSLNNLCKKAGLGTQDWTETVGFRSPFSLAFCFRLCLLWEEITFPEGTVDIHVKEF